MTLRDPDRCKHCDGPGRVVNTRTREGHRWRRRECATCTITVDGKVKPYRWNTYETIIDPTTQTPKA